MQRRGDKSPLGIYDSNDLCEIMRKPFDGVLGNSSELRLLDFLLPLQDIEFNITDLAEEVKGNRVTVTKVVKKFVEKDILKARRVPPVTYYSLNYDSPIVQWFQDGNNLFIEMMLGDEILYDIHDLIKQKQSMKAKKPPESVSEMPWTNLMASLIRPIPIAGGDFPAVVIDGTASIQPHPFYWNEGTCIQSRAETPMMHQRFPSVI